MWFLADDSMSHTSTLHGIAVATLPQVAFLIDADIMLHDSGSDRMTVLILVACALMPLSPYSFCLQARD
jgi:hypothetical protein